MSFGTAFSAYPATAAAASATAAPLSSGVQPIGSAGQWGSSSSSTSAVGNAVTGPAATSRHGFVPSPSEPLLRTAPSEPRHAAAGAAPRPSVVPVGGVQIVNTADLLERSAFLYGLLHTDNVVHDVRDAIATVAAAAAHSAADTDDKDGPELRRRPGRSASGGSALRGVFYFPAQPPWPDMPWRPRYKSVTLLCVFATVDACQRAIAGMSDAPRSVRDDIGAASRVASLRLILRPACDAALSPEGTDTALLTYLTAPQLADLLVRRRRMRAPLERGASDSAGYRAAMAEEVDAMLAYVRANPAPARLSSAAARLYAAILSPQSPYTVDWTAAQVAINRGDGTVVPEMSVVGPWTGTGATGNSNSDVLREHDRPSATETAGSGRERGSGGVTSSAEGRAPYGARRGDGTHRVPLTLQEEDYRKRYGVTPQRRAGRGVGDDGADAHSGIVPSRSALYLGVRHLVRGATWALKRLRETLGEGEAPLLNVSGESAGPSLSAPVPPALPRGSSLANAVPSPHPREHFFDEPPRQRQRTESGAESRAWGDDGHRPSNVMVIPRYNAVGTALSWLPGFHHIGRFFVSAVTVLKPEGAPRRHLQQQQHLRRQRQLQELRRSREGAATRNDDPAWEALVSHRYAQDKARLARAPQEAQHAPPVQDSVLSWMSPARGTGWPAAPWPPASMLQPQQPQHRVTGPMCDGKPITLPWKPFGTAEPFVQNAAGPFVGGGHTAAADSSAGALTTSSHAASVLPRHDYAAYAPTPVSALRQFSRVSPTEIRRTELGPAASRRPAIRVERVSVDIPLHNNDGTSFMSHLRRRGQKATAATREGEAAESALLPRPSLADELRSFTRDAPERGGGTPPHHLNKKTREERMTDASEQTQGSGRVSRRTVSFTLPDDKQ